jgi:PIN domain nuclease of toxin-antitoxin system
MIIAQAETSGLVIVTKDGYFGKYPVETIW